MTSISNLKAEINGEIDKFSILLSSWIRLRVYRIRIKKMQPEVSGIKNPSNFLYRLNLFPLNKFAFVFIKFGFFSRIKSFVLGGFLFFRLYLLGKLLKTYRSYVLKKSKIFEYFK
jgi:hypothetical protein